MPILDSREKKEKIQFLRNKEKGIVFCLNNCSGQVEGKIVQVFGKICRGRKMASRKGFQGRGRRPRPRNVPRCPFSTKAGFFEHEDTFFPPRQKNYVNRVLFFFLQDFGRVYRLQQYKLSINTKNLQKIEKKMKFIKRKNW